MGVWRTVPSNWNGLCVFMSDQYISQSYLLDRMDQKKKKSHLVPELPSILISHFNIERWTFITLYFPLKFKIVFITPLPDELWGNYELRNKLHKFSWLEQYS